MFPVKRFPGADPWDDDRRHFMADKKTYSIKENVTVTDEVLAIIVGLAATEVKGVSSLAGNLTGDNITKAGRSRLQKAIKISGNEDESLSVSASINIEYDFVIPEVCQAVQDKVKQSVENMTGIGVSAVDIRIASVTGTSGS